MKKQSVWFAGMSLLLAAALLGAFSQTGEDLFQKALRLERNEGKLMEAIGLYQRVVTEAKDVSLAAQAQLRIGLCHEKLGRKNIQQAQEAFQKVIDNYPSRSDEVKIAMNKLSEIQKARGIPAGLPEGLQISKIWTGPPGGDFMGAVSPDGKFLCFSDWETGDLAIRELEAGKNRRLTNKGSWQKSPEFCVFSGWAPDSRQVLYSWYNKEHKYELRTIDIDKREPHVLHSGEGFKYIHPFDWSPDGGFVLAGLYQKSRTFKLAKISVADKSLRVIKEVQVDPGSRGGWGFVFSPDGKHIAYDLMILDNGKSNRDIMIMNSEGEMEAKIIAHPADDYVLDWTPDGKNLLFVSDRTGSRSLWRIPVCEGKPLGHPALVKSDIESITSLGFTRNGDFFYSPTAVMFNIYVAKIDQDSGEVLMPPAKEPLLNEDHNRSPDFSKDGRFLAYISWRGPRDSQSLLCIKDLSGKTEEKEYIPDLESFGYPRWAPDGRSVSLEAMDKNGQKGIFRFDFQTGKTIPLIKTSEEEVVLSHRWSPDGGKIFYAVGQRAPRSSRIFSYEFETGNQKLLLEVPGDLADIDISPNGKWISVLNRGQKRDLRIMPAEGGEVQSLHEHEVSGNFVAAHAWSADGRSIFFYSQKDKQNAALWTLWKVEVKSRTASKIDIAMIHPRHFSVHPDGQRITFESRGFKEMEPDVWMMRNFLPKPEAKK